MNILAIETSCDETGVTILSLASDTPELTLLGNALASQIDLHAQYGGVFPALAKRAHAEKMPHLLRQALTDAGLYTEIYSSTGDDYSAKISELCTKDTDLAALLVPFLNTTCKPDIDYIAVTVGPGLEPALWVGVNTAKVLSTVWNIPVIPINHMEGHIVTAAYTTTDARAFTPEHLNFPLLSLLVSGGHTELVRADTIGSYEKIGQTRDDAVGEAFDKVARMLGLPYPGGPAVSKLAAAFRATHTENPFTLPRPMMHSGDFDFSFSGIKTAALYAIRDLTGGNTRELTDDEKMALACAFEDAAIEVLVYKTIKAIREHHIQTIIVGGGVAGNTYLRSQLTTAVQKENTGITLLFPEPWLATDNAVMIALAAAGQITSGQIKTASSSELKADGNLSL